jgi:hypothetical protein
MQQDSKGKKARKKILVLRQYEPVKQTFVISESTQIGRGISPEWAVKGREIPERFKDLDILITTLHSSQISRNHTGIFRGDDNNEDEETFYITDLNSLNGTYLNGERLRKEQEKALSIGDRIELSKDLELKITDIRNANQNHHALLVGNEGFNLVGVEPDLKKLAEQLNRRGFAGNIRTLLSKKFQSNSGKYIATKQNILDHLDEAAYLTTNKSHFIFHYSGHGDQYGLCLGDEKITPSELYLKLKNIRGKKAIILDCCHAGTFMMQPSNLEEMAEGGTFLNKKNKILIPQDTLVMAACTYAEKAYEAPQATIAGGQYMGKFTATLVKYLDKHKESFDLANLEKEFESALAGSPFYIHHQKPVFNGPSYTMVTAHTNIFKKSDLAELSKSKENEEQRSVPRIFDEETPSIELNDSLST